MQTVQLVKFIKNKLINNKVKLFLGSGSLDTNCLSCSGNKFLSGNTCVTTCPDGYYGSNF
jgi:hypothetical protein